MQRHSTLNRVGSGKLLLMIATSTDPLLRPPPKPGRDRAKLREACFLLIIGVALAGTAVALEPDDDPGPKFSNYFTIQVPISVGTHDGPSGNPKEVPNALREIEVVEAHDAEAMNGLVSPAMTGMPTHPKSGTKRLLIVIAYEAGPKQQAEITVRLSLPPGAQVPACHGWPVRMDCNSPNATGPAARPNTDNFLEAKGQMVPGLPFAFVILDVQNTDGIAYAISRKHITVRYPLVWAMPPPSPTDSIEPAPQPSSSDVWAPIPSVRIGTTVMSDEASTTRWSQNPTSGLNVSGLPAYLENPDSPLVSASIWSPSATEDLATWEYRYAARGDGAPPNVTGIRQSVDDSDADALLYIGVALGAAGAAIIGSVQAFIGWVYSLAESERRRRSQRRWVTFGWLLESVVKKRFWRSVGWGPYLLYAELGDILEQWETDASLRGG